MLKVNIEGLIRFKILFSYVNYFKILNPKNNYKLISDYIWKNILVSYVDFDAGTRIVLVH